MFNPDNVVTITSLNSTANNADGVSISLQQGQTQLLDGVCTRVLVYPMQVLQNFQREDISLLFVQFWLLYVSFVAVSQFPVKHARFLTQGCIGVARLCSPHVSNTIRK